MEIEIFKPTFTMLVGLPASGKSTYANENGDDALWLSSDNLRQEIYGDINDQTDPAMIFQEMAKRTKEALKDGQSVIYDATNISRKKRKGLLQQLPKGVHKKVVYMTTPFKTAVTFNHVRERTVPYDAIKRMYKNLQVPIFSEGWDEIEFDYSFVDKDFPEAQREYITKQVMLNNMGYRIMEELARVIPEVFIYILDMAQDSKYHAFSVSRHTYHVYDYVFNNYHGQDKELMLWVAMLHDTGKHFCKNFKNRKGEPSRYANFIGHEHVSAQLAVHVLKRLGFNTAFIHQATTLIQFHMYLLDERANRDKLMKQVGKDMFDKLELLREADTLAH